MLANYESNGGRDTIRINMLGGFKIEAGGCAIADTAARTHQLWHLLEYLVAFRDRAISQGELIAALWPDNDIDNPSNALKNLVYRVRSALEANKLPYAREMVTYAQGCYRWNSDLDTYVDAEHFEELVRQASAPELAEEERSEKYIRAIGLYKGDYLPGSRFESWVAPLSDRYRSMYFKCVRRVLDLLFESRRYGETEAICRKALAIDPFEENAHRYLLMSLVRQDRRAQAMEHYRDVTDMFFRELGITPSAAIRELYRDVIKTVNDVELDISVIEEDLKENDISPGAFYCEYEVFKSLYRLEARTVVRSGQSLFISLITVTGAGGGGLDLKSQSRAMDALYEVIRSSLRRGDVFSRFSAAQYVLMLPTLTYENCLMVMDRITKRYKQAYRSKAVEIFAKVQPLTPAEDPENRLAARK